MYDPYADVDEQTLPATQKQLAFARTLALRNQVILPADLKSDRRKLSAWIDKQKILKPIRNTGPSAKQIALAQKLSRIKKRAIPEECFQDRALMSRWIDRAL